ncbi:unnamed protein product [Rhodiola kirilowii]
MSSRISHGLQTCLEPRLTEPCILRLILAPPKPRYESRSDSADVKKMNGKTSGWNFIEALSNTSLQCKERKEQEQVYIHPSVKKSTDHLSDKSLEMCTESLGSETGSNIMEGTVSDSAFCFSVNTSRAALKNIKGQSLGSRKIKVNQNSSFPPPLTSMTGASGYVRVKPRREDGRLVLKAVSMPSSEPFFHVKRANGRLKLRVAKSEVDVSGPNSDGDYQDFEDEAKHEFFFEAEESIFGKEHISCRRTGNNHVEWRTSTST